MLTALIVIIAVLMISHRVITAIDYFLGIPVMFYRVEAYISYTIAVFSIGLTIMQRGEPINILYIILAIYWGIQALLDYLDYKYEIEKKADEKMEQQEQEKQSKREEG